MSLKRDSATNQRMETDALRRVMLVDEEDDGLDNGFVVVFAGIKIHGKECEHQREGRSLLLLRPRLWQSAREAVPFLSLCRNEQRETKASSGNTRVRVWHSTPSDEDARAFSL